MLGWERFCGSRPYVSRPRVARGSEIVTAARQVAAWRAQVDKEVRMDPNNRRRRVQGLENYLYWLNFAAKNGHPVVKWVLPPDGDDDEESAAGRP